jgi:two-component system chemotaxis response regulator CheY
MSDGVAEGASGLGLAALGEYGGELALACAEALGAALARPVELDFVDVSALPAGEVADGDEPIVDQLLAVTGDAPGFVHAVLPLPLALALAGLGRKLEGEALESVRRGSFDAEARPALQELMRAPAEAVGRVLGARGLGALEVQDGREVPEPASDPSWLDARSFLRMRFRVAIEGDAAAGTLDLLFADAANEAARAETVRCVCFVEPIESVRRGLGELSRPLGFRPLGLEPAELRGEPDERVLGAAALVVPFDLAGCAGLELVEALAGEARLAAVPIVVAAERPTREQVFAALRAGARSFVRLPYEGEELRQRILAARGEAAAASGGHTGAGAAPEQA